MSGDQGMRRLLALIAVLVFATISSAQAPEVKPRFDVLHNAEFYKQDSPQQTLISVVGALGRDRYDYVLAHLLDPAYVNSRLATTQSYFERIAADQVAQTAAGRLLKGAELQSRIQQVRTTLGFKQLAEQMKEKMADDPDSLKDLKRLAREGIFMDSGDVATATLKDIKDRALYFKKVEGRWFLENRKEDKPAAKE